MGDPKLCFIAYENAHDVLIKEMKICCRERKQKGISLQFFLKIINQCLTEILANLRLSTCIEL